MKQKFITLEKQSKRKQREYHAAHRGNWGGLNPVTRKPPNPKAYNRKKSGQRFEHEPLSGFHSKSSVSSFAVYLKGKSSLMIIERGQPTREIERMLP